LEKREGGSNIHLEEESGALSTSVKKGEVPAALCDVRWREKGDLKSGKEGRTKRAGLEGRGEKIPNL